MPKIDGISAIAVILIASFAIDRIVTGTLFLLSFVGPLSSRFPDPATLDDRAARRAAEKKHRLVYFLLAGLLGIGALAGAGGVRIFSVLGFPEIHPWLDTIVTGLVMVAGSDRVGNLLRLGGDFAASGPAPAAAGGGGGEAPIEIKGKLILEERRSSSTSV